MTTKLLILAKDTKKLLPPEFHHYIDHFLLKDIESLLSYQPWDYKIKLILGKEAPYHKNRHFLPKELRCIKKWINKILDKAFIQESSLLATAPMLLVAKPDRGVYIY